MKDIFSRKRLVLLFTTVLLAGVLIGCGKESESENEDDTPEKPSFENAVTGEFRTGPIPEVTMTMEDGGEIVIDLYPVLAPNTVNNFISLVEDGYYDGLTFHRVVPGFVIQGGDPNGDGTGGPGYGISGEFASNDFENNLSHERGVISMARSGHPDSAGSQFFLMHDDSLQLDGDYAGFGEVKSGLEVIDEIASVETTDPGTLDRPVEEQVIKSVTVELNGYEPNDPVTIKN